MKPASFNQSEILLNQIKGFIIMNFSNYKDTPICVNVHVRIGNMIFDIRGSDRSIDLWGDGFIPSMNSFLKSLHRETIINSILTDKIETK